MAPPPTPPMPSPARPAPDPVLQSMPIPVRTTATAPVHRNGRGWATQSLAGQLRLPPSIAPVPPGCRVPPACRRRHRRASPDLRVWPNPHKDLDFPANIPLAEQCLEKSPRERTFPSPRTQPSSPTTSGCRSTQPCTAMNSATLPTSGPPMAHLDLCDTAPPRKDAARTGMSKQKESDPARSAGSVSVTGNRAEDNRATVLSITESTQHGTRYRGS